MGWIVPLITTAASLLGQGMTKPKKKGGAGTTVTQEPLVTPEQQEAMDIMMQYGKGGGLPGAAYKPGEAYGEDLGEYGMTPTELAGQGKLMNLLESGAPEMMGLASDELRSLLTTDQYDPFSETGMYKPYKQQTLREIKEAQDRFKQGQAFGGTLFGTSTAEGMVDIETRGTEALSSKLAELYDQFTQRKFSAIPMALQTAGMGENIEMGRIGASQQYGALPRILKDMEAKEKYQDWMRGRSEEEAELQRQLATVQNLTSPAQWGSKSITLPDSYYQDSPWSKVLDTITGLSGQWLGGQLAKN